MNVVVCYRSAVVRKCKYTIAMWSDFSAFLSVAFDKVGVLEEIMKRTRAVPFTSNPVWNQKFEFDEIVGGEYLKLKCLYEETFGDESDEVRFPSYFQTLGNVILKRLLLLVLIFDRGKCQSSLPIKYGINGLDRSSFLLFNVKSNIKSSHKSDLCLFEWVLLLNWNFQVHLNVFEYFMWWFDYYPIWRGNYVNIFGMMEFMSKVRPWIVGLELLSCSLLKVQFYSGIIPTPLSECCLLVMKQPVGIVGVITSWNFLLEMLTRIIGPALTSGCTIIIKTALAVAELYTQVGIPPCVVTVIMENAPEIGNTLMTSTQVRKITFTGSTVAGKKLMAGAANIVNRATLELGGNAPCIIFDDADMDVAVKGSLASKFRNSGQTYVCANRVPVQEGIYKKISSAFSNAVQQPPVGDGFVDSVAQGPLINDAAVQEVEKFVSDAILKGERMLMSSDENVHMLHMLKPTLDDSVHVSEGNNIPVMLPVEPSVSGSDDVQTDGDVHLSEGQDDGREKHNDQLISVQLGEIALSNDLANCNSGASILNEATSTNAAKDTLHDQDVDTLPTTLIDSTGGLHSSAIRSIRFDLKMQGSKGAVFANLKVRMAREARCPGLLQALFHIQPTYKKAKHEIIVMV